jgi:hypothetical protein
MRRRESTERDNESRSEREMGSERQTNEKGHSVI